MVLSPLPTRTSNNIKRLRKFPTAQKMGFAFTISQDGHRQKLSNYRPMTLLNKFSKSFDIFNSRTIAEAFVTTISDSQYGFWPRRSVVFQLLCSLTQTYSVFGAARLHCLLVVYVFSQTLDKVKPSQLLAKLLQLDISKGLFENMRDCFSGKVQKVNETKSGSLTTTLGVPQGSVLGSLLFLFYLNDLPIIVYSSVALLFADELEVVFQGDNKRLTKFQNDSNTLRCWSIQNQLLFNYEKCSLTELKVGKRSWPPVPAASMLGNNEIFAKTPV